MNSKAQKTVVVPTPKLLRLELQTRRAGPPEAQRFIIKDSNTGRQCILTPSQFFTLDQLSSCDTLEQLEQVYEAEFSRPFSGRILDETVKLVARAKLWGRHAHSHPLLGAKLPAQQPGQAFRQRRAVSDRRFLRAKDVSQPSEPDEHETLPADESDHQDEPTEAELTEIVAESETVEPANALIPVAPGRDGLRQGRRQRGQQGRMPGSSGSVGQQQAAKNSSLFPQWAFFDARPMIDFLLPIVSPLRKLFLWSVPLLIVNALFIIANHTENFFQEADRLLESLSVIMRMLVSLLTVNLLSTVTRALAARHFRMRVFGFGVRMVFWVIPRFLIGAKVSLDAPRREQAWVHAMPLLTKLFIAGAGVLLWYLTRTNDSTLSHFGFWLSSMGFVTFILTAIPLFPASGYQLLAVATNEPNLRNKALGALKAAVTGKSLPEGGGILLAVFGLSSLLFMLLLLVVIFYILGVASQKQFHTTGITVVTGFLAFFLYKIYAHMKKNRAQRGQGPQQSIARRRGGPGQGMELRRTGQLQTGRGQSRQIKAKMPRSRRIPWLKLLFAGLILVVMFLPYSYESGGQLLIRPIDSQEITTEYDGIIEEVFFEGGETVDPGVLLAKLSSADAARQVNIHDARIKEQQAEVDRLLAKPTKEEIDLAERALRVEETKAEFSKLNLARKEKVFEKNVISQEEVESARREHEVDLGNVSEAKANLALVMAGATREEILAARAELVRWEEERNLYQDQYEKSFLYMPIKGKLITQHLKQRIGQYLSKGEVFAVVENTTQVLGEIEVPEFDAGLIKLGAEVRVRVWAYSDEIFLGKVTGIDTNVEERSFGNIVKVLTLLENEDQRLKSGMTGYAKVSGETRPVWEVLFLTVVRFVRVEMWSWIP